MHRIELADDETVIAKRCRSGRAAVEAVLYEQVLPRLSAPTLRYYGKLDEPETDFSWIFVEEAVGREYVADDYSIADIAIWPWISRYEWQTVDMKQYPNVLRWYTTIANKPATQKGYKVPKDVGDVPIPK